jgi:hypothetical protein
MRPIRSDTNITLAIERQVLPPTLLALKCDRLMRTVQVSTPEHRWTVTRALLLPPVQTPAVVRLPLAHGVGAGCLRPTATSIRRRAQLPLGPVSTRCNLLNRRGRRSLLVVILLLRTGRARCAPSLCRPSRRRPSLLRPVGARCNLLNRGDRRSLR